MSPLLSNVALSVLDEHFARAPGGPASTSWERAKRRRQGLPNYRLARYADDWTLMVAGTRNDALALREEAAQVLARIGLHLSEEKTLITHARTGAARFLGYEVHVHQDDTVHTPSGRRRINGAVALRVPADVVRNKCRLYMQEGAPIHRAERLNARACRTHGGEYFAVCRVGSRHRGERAKCRCVRRGGGQCVACDPALDLRLNLGVGDQASGRGHGSGLAAGNVD